MRNLKVALAVAGAVVIGWGFTASADTPAVRAALYVDRGCRGNGVIFWAEILRDSPDVEVKLVDGADIRNGALDDRELIVMPGGWGGQQYKAMGDEGAAKLRAFVANGGKYFGTCCGFSMTLNEEQASPKRLRMLPFRRIKGADRGQLAATVSFNRRGAEWLGIRAGDWTVRYSKGPVVEMTEPVPPATNVEVLATMNCELVQKGRLEGPMYGRPAAVRADYGKGEMLVFNCHPEIYLKSREIVAAGLGALTGRKVRLAPRRPPTPGAMRIGYATDEELVSSKKAVEGYFKLRENPSIVVVPVSQGQLDEGFAPLVDRVVTPEEAERNLTFE